MTMNALKQQACTDCNCILAFGPRRALARWSAQYRKPNSALHGQVAGHRLQKGTSSLMCIAVRDLTLKDSQNNSENAGAFISRRVLTIRVNAQRHVCQVSARLA